MITKSNYRFPQRTDIRTAPAPSRKNDGGRVFFISRREDNLVFLENSLWENKSTVASAISPRQKERKRELIRGPLQAAGCLHAQALGDVFAAGIRRFLVDHPRLELDNTRPSVGHRSGYVENPYNCEIYAHHRSCGK
jgi:hypothetical protein